MRNSSIVAVVVYLLIAILPVVSCGHGTSTGRGGVPPAAVEDGISTSIGDSPATSDSTDSGKTADPKLLQTLKDELTRQLTELHGDYTKMTSSAPDGDSGRVTDLSYDTGTHMLQWTYVNLADYDSNGEVGVPDITPIANNYLAVTTDGIGDDALESWIDGDKSGDVGVPDITPIANNYLARVDGYRVYRRDPGDTAYKRLPNLDNSASYITVEFEAGSYAVPPTFTFEDKPPVTGMYEYYIVAYASGAGESQTQSNHIIVESDGYSDTSAPVWDDTVGITGATDNGDQSVTVTFGTATDIAVPPAPATPPVTYSVYYSTETPMDFDTATKESGLTESPWVSPELSGGTTYYFAVRAVDGASPKNEDANTAELPVAVAGEPVEDQDPPVWVWNPNAPEYGVEKILVGDGKLTITRADAVDALSPPVHYDLYYLSTRISSKLFIQNEDHETVMHPETQVIRDIPKEFEFPWENRHGVILLVRARDSANPANETINIREFTTAPTNLVPRTLDIELPWMDDPDLHNVASSQTFDPETHNIYAAYVPHITLGSSYYTPALYFVELNTDTLNYNVQEILSKPTDESKHSNPKIRLSWTGELWIQIYEEYGFGSGIIRFFHCQPGGIWKEWDADNIPGGWNGSFDHNGNPAFFWGDYSDVAYNREAVYYEWWDETERDWISEFICDPGGEGITHVRPDGVVQVVMERDTDTVFGGSEGAIYGRIHERSTDGVWSEVYSVEGWLSNQNDHYDTWDSEWAWGAAVKHADDSVEEIVYGQSGYEVLPGLKIGDEYVNYGGRAWPSGSSYHILPLYFTNDDITKKLCNNFLEYGVNTDWTSFGKEYFLFDTFYYPVDGYGFVIYKGPDFDTNRGVLRIWTTPPGVSILDP